MLSFQTSFWPWDLPQKAPATSSAIKNASTSSSSTASMKDVHPACALAAAWTRWRTRSQSRSSSRFLQPRCVSAGQGVHCPLLGLYQTRGHDNSDGPGRCDVLRDKICVAASHVPARSNEEIDDPMQRTDRCTKPPTARNHPPSSSCLGSTWKSPPMMNGCVWEVRHWPIALKICQFS